MPLALIVLFVVPGLLAPVLTARLLREGIAEERRQIALDNAAIVLGQGVRLALRALGTAERALRGFDVGHDALHACALVKPPCRAADQVAERTLRAMHRSAETAFFQALKVAAARAALELGGAHGRVIAPTVTVRPVRCGLCRLPVGWRVSVPPGAVVESTRPERRRAVRWEGRNQRWDYRVRWDETAAAFSSKAF